MSKMEMGAWLWREGEESQEEGEVAWRIPPYQRLAQAGGEQHE